MFPLPALDAERGITICGAGLAGSLLAILLAQRGYRVRLFERLGDLRREQIPAGRSINLALAARGIRALELASVMPQVEPLLIAMPGRMLHDLGGESTFLPYGQANEVIHSVSRPGLNRVLLDAAERAGVEILFRHRVTGVDFATRKLLIHAEQEDRHHAVGLHHVIAADGAGSVVRHAFVREFSVPCSEALLPHAYKELTIPPDAQGRWRIHANALHIWPRGGFMLIALPNPGGDFTCTLFLANEGSPSFGELVEPAAVGAFFRRWFGDVAELIPDLESTFLRNPLGVLGTVRCRRWHAGEVLLIGDAAHAIVPFHGQGMNLAFEDCALLDRMLDEAGSWREVFERFEAEQLPNANAIADMALENYVEMRDTVRDPKFALQKALSFELEKRLPRRFIPRYSMVMFHAEIPYAVAFERGAVQQALLDELTRDAHALADIDLDAATALARDRLPPLP